MFTFKDSEDEVSPKLTGRVLAIAFLLSHKLSPALENEMISQIAKTDKREAHTILHYKQHGSFLGLTVAELEAEEGF